MGETIGLRRAAEELDVHYMTAYRYVRTGQLPAHKVGGQWQVDLDDLEVLVSGSAPRTSGGPPRAVHRERIETRLIAGDETGAWQVLESAMSSGADPAEVLTEVLSPALRSIGARWADGELSISDEHRASAVAHRLIARLGPRFSRPGRRRGTVVLGSAAGDQHSLPTAIFGDLLRGAGLEVIDLGADCPAGSFVDAVAAVGAPCVIGVCVTAPDVAASVPGLVEEIGVELPGCPVLVGGGAVPGPLTPTESVAAFVQAASELASSTSPEARE